MSIKDPEDQNCSSSISTFFLGLSIAEQEEKRNQKFRTFSTGVCLLLSGFLSGGQS